MHVLAVPTDLADILLVLQIDHTFMQAGMRSHNKLNMERNYPGYICEVINMLTLSLSFIRECRFGREGLLITLHIATRVQSWILGASEDPFGL
jgi:hypothetical protein